MGAGVVAGVVVDTGQPHCVVTLLTTPDSWV